MGKRRLHAHTYYQCDYTGIAMRAAHCYMPQISTSGKLTKKGGAYCNWESVLAHAHMQHNAGTIDAEELDKIKAHVQHVAGTTVSTAPAHTELQHFGGSLSVEQWHQWCVASAFSVKVVVWHPGHELEELSVVPYNGVFNFAEALNTGANCALTSFHSTRKKTKASDRDLCVWHYPDKTLPHNAQASAWFRMQLYGPVLLVQQSCEASFMPRDRWISFTQADYLEQFATKRKRKAPDPPALSVSEFGDLKTEMQSSINTFEAGHSATAAKPSTVAVRATSLSSGKTLAAKVAARHRSGLPS